MTGAGRSDPERRPKVGRRSQEGLRRGTGIQAGIGEGETGAGSASLSKGADRLDTGKMADGGEAKRPKLAEDGATAAAEVVEFENEQLRRRGRHEEGICEVLSESTMATVDLSRIDTGIVGHMASFLGTSHELLNLALTCKSFGWRQPTSASDLELSFVEEVARQTVCSRATDAETGCLPQYVSGAATWLSILCRHEHPLKLLALWTGILLLHNASVHCGPELRLTDCNSVVMVQTSIPTVCSREPILHHAQTPIVLEDSQCPLVQIQ